MGEWSEYEQSLADDARETESLFHIALLRSGADSDARWDAIRALQYRPTRDIFDSAVKLCKSADPFERATGADILAQFSGTRDLYRDERVEILIALLRDTDAGVQSSAAIGLGHICDARAIEPLCVVMNHENAIVRYGVVLGLSGHEDPRAIAALITLSDDIDFDTRNWATLGLGSQIDTDTPEIRAALWRRVADEDYEIRGEALKGLALRKDLRIVDALIADLERDESSAYFYSWSAEAAESLGDARLVPDLEKLALKFPEDGQIQNALKSCRGRK